MMLLTAFLLLVVGVVSQVKGEGSSLSILILILSEVGSSSYALQRYA